MSRNPSETLKKLCYYKWEFLRRNPEYQKAYKEFSEFCRREGYDPEDEIVRAERFESDPSKRKKVKYGLALLEDPKKHIPKDEIEENPGPTWADRTKETEEKVKAGGVKAIKTAGKVALIVGVVGAVCLAIPVIAAAGAATAVVAAPAVGLAALDPMMVLAASDGQKIHFVCVSSWLD